MTIKYVRVKVGDSHRVIHFADQGGITERYSNLVFSNAAIIRALNGLTFVAIPDALILLAQNLLNFNRAKSKLNRNTSPKGSVEVMIMQSCTHG